MSSYTNGYNKNSSNKNFGTQNKKPFTTQPPRKAEPLNKTDYVKQAENIIREHLEQSYKCITSNKIRNVLTLMNELYNMARVDSKPELDEKTLSHIQYVKMRLVYESGRDDTVKSFINYSGLLSHLDSIKNNKEELFLVCRYTEALVAYHKFYAPKER